MSRPDTVVILAAGQGTRMKLGGPKVLAPLCGRPMIAWVVDQALALDPQRILVVIGHGGEQVRAVVEDLDASGRVRCIEQTEQLGTGHAVQMCLPELGEDPGVVCLLYGDMPVLASASIEALCALQATTHGGAAILTSSPLDPRGFGRIVRGSNGALERIVEEKDASADERAIQEVNLGVYAFPGAELVRLLPLLSNENAQSEYYVTDIIAALVAEGRSVEALGVEDEAEAIGVNTLSHLAEARFELQMRILEQHMAAGVRIEDPASTYIDHGVEIGAGTTILPCTVIRGGVTIGERCEVGPFTHVRPGSVLEEGAEIGNFTEAKNTRLGAHSKAKHLSYLGDAQIGERVNIGAGTIFANYDGKTKRACIVERDGFIGSGTVLVAPARVGEGATTGAGAVVTRGSEIPAGDTWVGVPARPIADRKSSTSPSTGA